MKKCKRCGLSKPQDNYYGNDTSCKICRRSKIDEYRKQNVLKIQASDRARFTPERAAANKANYRERMSTPEGRARERASKKKYVNSTRRAANTIVGNAVRDGTLMRQPCEKCGANKVDAHHEDYTKPLDVVWLCREHHGLRHREINEDRRNAGK